VRLRPLWSKRAPAQQTLIVVDGLTECDRVGMISFGIGSRCRQPRIEEISEVVEGVACLHVRHFGCVAHLSCPGHPDCHLASMGMVRDIEALLQQVGGEFGEGAPHGLLQRHMAEE